MIWYTSKTLPFLFLSIFDNKLKNVREYATLYPHLNYNENNNDTVDSGNKNAVESKSKSNDDTVESESYNGPYKSKEDFLFHLNQHSIDFNRKMKCRHHYRCVASF